MALRRFRLRIERTTSDVLPGIPAVSTLKSSPIRFRRIAASPEIAALADNTSWIAAKPARRSSAFLRQQLGNGRQRGNQLVEQQHEELYSRNHRLELRNRQTRSAVDPANATQRFEAALIDHSAHRTDIEQAGEQRPP